MKDLFDPRNRRGRRAGLLLAFASALLLAAALPGARGTTQGPAQPPRTPTRLPPLPVKEKNFPRLLAPVVEAEQAFAQYSIDHGMKDAFLRFAAAPPSFRPELCGHINTRRALGRAANFERPAAPCYLLAQVPGWRNR